MSSSEKTTITNKYLSRMTNTSKRKGVESAYLTLEMDRNGRREGGRRRDNIAGRGNPPCSPQGSEGESLSQEL